VASWTLDVPAAAGACATPEGQSWLAPARWVANDWVEVSGAAPAALETATARLLPVLSALLESDSHRTRVGEELASRYEEIDLLYTITEILGSTVRLDEAAQVIVREVAAVVGARRASIMVHDATRDRLRTVAARGFTADDEFFVPVDDPHSVAARVFRDRRVVVHDPVGSEPHSPVRDRPYRGQAYLSVPICYASQGGPPRCIGVINLTDRTGGDRFTAGDRKLLTAIASQVGAAIENVRLAERDRQQQGVRRELELAHDLQLRLLPSPAVLYGEAQVAARCTPVDSVGGDFYTFSRLGQGRVAVMLGDVSSHGFGAALVMALVLSAAGIHVETIGSPEATLDALLNSVGDELKSAEMYFTVFYGVLDRQAGTLRYASAGHPHAFRIPRDGEPERLLATSPPVGLAVQGVSEARQVPWDTAGDLLCLWTDGLVDATNDEGERYGDARLLDALLRRRSLPVEAILAGALAEADAWTSKAADDRTLLVMRL
jgi:sigma-B regulation protein RsbU (phosphoserine phosphatase)